MISFSSTGSARRRAGAWLVSLSTLGACTMGNPAFEEGEESLGDGESGASEKGTSATSLDDEGGEGITSAESEVSSTSGDGDGDASSESSFDTGVSSTTFDTGDGDGDVSSESFDTGDGDGDGDAGSGTSNSGDGDGDGAMPVCETLIVHASTDTFFQNGPTANVDQDTACAFDGSAALGAVNVPCSELNFGGVSQHWIGGEGAAESMYAFHIPANPLSALPDGADIEQVRFKVPILLAASQTAGEFARLSHVTYGDAAAWNAGVGLGTLPEAPNDEVATYKYRNYGMSVTWTGASAGMNISSPFGSVPLLAPPGTSEMSFTIDALGFTTWVETVLPGAGNGWMLTSDAEPFQLWIDSKEGATGGSAARFEIDFCYDP